MIDQLAYAISMKIKNHLKEANEENVEIISYGLNIIIYNILVLGIVFIISAVLGLLEYTLITFAVYGSLRVCAGGAHARTRVICFISTSTVLFVPVLLSVYVVKENHLPVILAVFLLSFISVIRYAPGDTLEKPIINKSIIKWQRIIAVAVTAVLLLITLILLKNAYISNIITFTTIPVAFFLTPPGYRLLKCERSRAAID